MDKEWMFEAFGDIDETYVQEATRKPVNWTFILKIAAAAAAVVVLIISIATLIQFDQRGYYIVKSGDSWRMIMSMPGKISPSDDHYSSQEWVGISFASLEEMRNDLLTGNLTEKERKALLILAEENGEIYCPNLDKLYIPVCPDGIEFTGSISWFGQETYTWGFDRSKQGSPNFYSFHMSLDNGDIFYEAIRNYKSLENGTPFMHSDFLVSKTMYDPSRNATEYYLSSKTTRSRVKEVYYAIESENKLMIVRERFNKWEDEVSGTTNIYIRQGDAFAFVSFDRYDERLPLEYIASFGLEKYN